MKWLGMMRRSPGATHVAVAISFSAFFFSGPVLSNPSGPVIRHGDIQIIPNGNTLQIIQGGSHGVIDWNRFSIDSGEVTQFLQPGASAATLNRVTGQDLSRINGSLLANGRVFLLNPNGIVIGPGGRVDTAGFTASTLDLSNNDFLQGGDLQFRGNSSAAVINLGTISAFEGDVFLLAESVLNEGTIRAPRGTVGLAAGNDILVTESGSERIFVRGSGSVQQDGVVNRGTVEANIAELKAHGGNIYGMAVRNEGRVAATGVSREGGQIFLRAGGSGGVRSTGELVARSVTTPVESTPQVARVEIDAGPGGDAEIGGTIDVSSDEARGGDIFILGKSLDLFSESVILADGDAGGGRVFVGGGRRGLDSSLTNATDVFVREGATISANAGQGGNGGEVILFAENRLDFQGDVSATGGFFSGDGGFVELSGKKSVFIPNLTNRIDLSAQNGGGGTLLIDPNTIHVVKGVPAGTVPSSPAQADELRDSDINTFLNTANLVIETDTSLTATVGNGDIIIEPGAFLNWTAPNNLTFNAARDFVMKGADSSIPEVASSIMGGGSLEVNAGRAVRIEGTISMDDSVTLNANQDTLMSGDFDGVTILNTVSATNSISIYGTSGDSDGNRGVVIGDASWGTSPIVSSASSDVYISGETRAPVNGSKRLGVQIEAPISAGGSYNPIMIDLQSGDFHLGVNGNLLATDSTITGLGYENTTYSFAGSVIPINLFVDDIGSSFDIDTLDFSAFTGPLVIDLEDFTMGVGSFSGIEDFVGNGSGSTIRGSSQADLISIFGNNEGMIEIGGAEPSSPFPPNLLTIPATTFPGPDFGGDPGQDAGDGNAGFFALNVDGGGGLPLPDTGGDSFSTFNYYSSPDPLSFRNFGRVNGAGGADEFDVDVPSGERFDGVLAGGSGDDFFEIYPGGRIGGVEGGSGYNTLSFRMFSNSVIVDYEREAATQVDSFRDISSMIGGRGRDTIVGTNGDDVVEITGNGSGSGGKGSRSSSFESFEVINGNGGNDRFTFRNQATVDQIIGGPGFDRIVINDSDLGGKNLYRISENKITRNPEYNFSELELIQLILGPGNDTVLTSGNGLTQLIDGGGGTNILDFGGAPVVGDNPFLVGGSTIVANRLAITGRGTSVNEAEELVNGPLVLLGQQLGNLFSGPANQNPPPGVMANNFSGGTGGGGSGPLGGAGTPGGGNAFGAAAAAVAAQASVTLMDGTVIPLNSPLDMGGGIPPVEVSEDLRDALKPEAWKELADAIELIGGTTIVNSDGAYSVDLSGVPPQEILTLLQQGLLAGAQQELQGALGMTLVIPLTSANGPIGIVTVPVEIDAATVALLDQLLNEEAFGELSAALDGG